MAQSSFFALFDIATIVVFERAATFAEQDDPERLLQLVWIYGGLLVGYLVTKFFIRHRWRSEIYFNQQIVHRQRLMPEFFRLNYTGVEKVGTGRLINIISDGVRYRVEACIELSYQVPNLVIKLLFSCYLLRKTGGIYGLLFIVGFALIHVVVWKINVYAMHRRAKRKEQQVSITRQLVRMIMTKQEVLQAGKIDQEVDTISGHADQATVYSYRVNDYVWAMFNVPLFLISLIGLYTIWYAYWSIKQWNFSIGLFAALVALSGYLTSSIMRSTDLFKNIMKNFTHIEKLRDLFDQIGPMSGYDQGEEFVYQQGEIRLEQVSYGYEATQPVLDGLDLTISGWQKTALVGVSGAGKTTIVKLIAGYLRPQAGRIVVDGQDLRAVSLKSYYEHIGYLTQEPNVFDGTVRENLSYGLDQSATDEQVARAIERAKCEFVYQLSEWLETEIGERGVRLSGGQKQRLAIAKIFLKDPEIVILDEPTAALDSFSEEAITEAMHNLFVGRTVIIIAHRLQTVRAADEIIVLSAGQVVERGRHDQLLANGGPYAQMLELQTAF